MTTDATYASGSLYRPYLVDVDACDAIADNKPERINHGAWLAIPSERMGRLVRRRRIHALKAQDLSAFDSRAGTDARAPSARCLLQACKAMGE